MGIRHIFFHEVNLKSWGGGEDFIFHDGIKVNLLYAQEHLIPACILSLVIVIIFDIFTMNQ